MSAQFSPLNTEYHMSSSDASSDAMVPGRQRDEELPNRELPLFCEAECCKLCSCWFGVVVAGLLVGIVTFLIFPVFGILFVALVPAAAIMGLARYVYGNQVTIGQMIVSFFETMLWMLPLLLWDLIWFAIDAALDKDGGVCALCLLAYFLQAYFFAGFCEEFVKYLVIARITSSLLTKDWRAMLVYGVCAGAGFASLENIMYVAQFGVATGVVRSFVSVPLHCTTGAIIGLNLANRRPVLPESGGISSVSECQAAVAYSKIIPRILFFPWLIHGTFDFCLMVSEGAATKFSFIGYIVALFVFVGGVMYARYLTLFTLTNNPAVKINIHDAIARGEPSILGQNRISTCWAGSTEWVCDCFFLCSCCCRSTPTDLEAIRSRNDSAGPSSVTAQATRQPTASSVVYVHNV